MSMDATCSVVDKEYVTPFDLMAMTRLAFGTAILVSTVLCIPDAIAILPSTHSAIAFITRVSGIWLSVFVQWFLAFLGILHIAAIINRGVVIGPSGIKLWRFSKLIPWSQIIGFGADARPLVTRLTLNAQPAIKLQLYVTQKSSVKTKNLDSLLFEPAAFISLVKAISSTSCGLVPDSIQVVLTRSDSESVKTAYKRSNTRSKLVTAYIAAMLVLFTGRGAARNYLYNMAGQSFNKSHYLESKHLCEFSLAVDGTYPYALDRLARCEYRLQDHVSAEQHWKKALKMKPDLVSAKVGLSNICIQRRQFDSAKSLLKTALRLEPQDIPVHLNLGYVSMQMGDAAESLIYFKKALQLAPSNPTVKLLSAQAYLEVGENATAKELLRDIKSTDLELHNRATLSRVKGILLARGERIE